MQVLQDTHAYFQYLDNTIIQFLHATSIKLADSYDIFL